MKRLSVVTRRGRSLRGTALIWFLGVTLPTTLFGGMLAADMSKLLIEHRRMSNAAEAAAAAGATKVTNNTYELDWGEAMAAASQAITQMNSTRGTPQGSVFSSRIVVLSAGVSSAYPTNPTYASSQTRMTVQVTYKPDLVLLPALNSLLGISRRSRGWYTVTRSADVCIPGVYDRTPGGSCTKPT